jgi:hypothetical protein
MSSAEDHSDHYLAVPDWFPRSLKDAARELHARAVRSKSAENAALVQRLVDDPRMKVVWTELQRRRRKDAVFVHEAAAPIRAARAKQHGGPLCSLLNDPQHHALFRYYSRRFKQLENARKEASANLREIRARMKRDWESNPEQLKRISGFASFADFEKSLTGAAAVCDDAPEIPTDQDSVEVSRAYQFAAMEVVFRKTVALGQSFSSTRVCEHIRHSYVERASKARFDAGFLERAGRHHINDETAMMKTARVLSDSAAKSFKGLCAERPRNMKRMQICLPMGISTIRQALKSCSRWQERCATYSGQR